MAADMSSEIRMFLEKIIDEKKFDNLSPELRQAMITSLYPRLQAHIFTAITKQLDGQTISELDKMLEGNADFTQSELQMFLRGRLKNIDEVTAAAMLEFRAVYLNA